MKELCDYCFCACCLRSVILLSPCHLTLSTTSPALSLSLSIKLSRYLTARIRAADTKICAQLCVQQLWATLCSLYPWPTFFFLNIRPEANGRVSGNVYQYLSVCHSNPVIYTRLISHCLVDYYRHYLRGMQLILSCPLFRSLKCNWDRRRHAQEQ